MKEYDAAVIGGGPAGITASLYLLRSGANIAWIEKLTPGGQVLLTERIDNYPGFPGGVKGYELIDLMVKHLEGFSFDRIMDDVLNIEPGENKNTIYLSEQNVQAKAIVICTGAEHKKLGLPGEEFFTGKGVSYCGLCDGQFYREQEVACIGGGNTALEEALYLSKLTKKVYLIHRRDKFRGDKIYQDKVFEQPNIEVLYDTVPLEIIGERQISALRLKNVKTDKQIDLKVDGLFIFVGIKPQVSFVPISIEQDQDGFIITDTEMCTNLPGIFAAGDIRSKRCRQVSTAVGDGAVAGYSAYLFLEK